MDNDLNSNLQGLIFDYIVVGSGPAGAVMAKTLSDHNNNSVLLLEAGENNDQDEPIKNSQLAFALSADFFPQYFWQGEGTPQEGLDGRTFKWTAGRLSGGSTSINGEQYVRPTPHVFNEWESLFGPMWSAENATENFTQLENYNGMTNNPAAHGYNGPIDIRQAPKEVPNMTEKLVLAIEQATGLEAILDYNDPNTPIGPFGRWQLYQKPNGQRESASTAFLSADIVDSNGMGINGRRLMVLYKSTALRILFKDNDAVGVDFLMEGKCMQAYGRKKVIISAGINSAQLLLLSGIGPGETLNKLGIPTIFDNPNVGLHLANHTLNGAFFSVNEEDIPGILEDPNALFIGGAFLPSPLANDSEIYRGVQLIGGLINDALFIFIIYLHPKSRGSIKIQNNDPLKIVLADEGFLADAEDLTVIKDIYKKYIKDIASRLSSIDPAYRLLSPSLDIINDDARLEEFIRNDFSLNSHQQSALRMAPSSQWGVVDRYGSVFGVNNLIVADDSIIPFIVDANTSAPAFLIGYTIAKHLLEESKPTS